MLKLLNSFSGVLESSYNPKQLYKCPARVLEKFAFGQMPCPRGICLAHTVIKDHQYLY